MAHSASGAERAADMALGPKVGLLVLVALLGLGEANGGCPGRDDGGGRCCEGPGTG